MGVINNVGELKAFLEKHNLPDDMPIISKGSDGVHRDAKLMAAWVTVDTAICTDNRVGLWRLPRLEERREMQQKVLSIRGQILDW